MVDGFPEAVEEIDADLESEIVLCAGDGGEGMLYVAGAVGFEDGLYVCAHDGVEGLDELKEGEPLSAGDVVYFSGGLFGGTGQEIGADVILDIGKVPGLEAVAIDHRGFAPPDHCDEFWDDGAVLRGGILFGSEHVEIAERNGFEAVDLVEDPAIGLAAEFADGIGREGHGTHAFFLGEVGIVAVCGGGCGIDDPFHLVFAGGLQHMEGAVYIDLVGSDRISHGAGNRG